MGSAAEPDPRLDPGWRWPRSRSLRSASGGVEQDVEVGGHVPVVGGHLASPALDHVKIFLTSPHLTLVLPNEILIIPSTSMRHISVTRSGAALPEAELDAIPVSFWERTASLVDR